MTRASKGSGWSLGSTVAPARFLAFLLVLAGGTAAAIEMSSLSLTESLVFGFDVAAATFLGSLLPFLRVSDAKGIRAHARANDANRVLVLALTVLTVMAVMAALAGELPRAAKGNDPAIIVLLITLALAWMFANSIFALHYAHVYYLEDRHVGGKDCAGLEFPNTPLPDYADFLYFSATIGMTFQTSDVVITSRHMRRVALSQSLTAFVFNLGIIALVINALAGLAG